MGLSYSCISTLSTLRAVIIFTISCLKNGFIHIMSADLLWFSFKPSLPSSNYIYAHLLICWRIELYFYVKSCSSKNLSLLFIACFTHIEKNKFMCVTNEENLNNWEGQPAYTYSTHLVDTSTLYIQRWSNMIFVYKCTNCTPLCYLHFLWLQTSMFFIVGK